MSGYPDSTVARLIDSGHLPDYTPAQALVLIALAHHHGLAGEAFPSERKLAEMTGANRRTVRAALASAIENGLIVGETTHRRAVTYRFTGALGAPLTGAQLVHSSTSTGAQTLASNRTEVKPRTKGRPLDFPGKGREPTPRALAAIEALKAKHALEDAAAGTT